MRFNDFTGHLLTRHARKSTHGAARVVLPIAAANWFATWQEPNRAQTAPLHIASSGDRYSTVTGVWWLDQTHVIAAHRNGLRMAVFDTTGPPDPLWTAPITHLSDDIAATRTAEQTWEVVVSGCWTCILSRYALKKLSAQSGEGFEVTDLGRLEHTAKDFGHGVAYDHEGRTLWSIHTGENPRFAIGETEARLRSPWGVRDLCYDPVGRRYIALAVSANPKRTSYKTASTTLWTSSSANGPWTVLSRLDGVHSDALDVWGNIIWIPDQVANELLAIDAKTGDMVAAFHGECFDFPHGLAVSPEGRIAVTNYGSSSIAVFDCESLLARSGGR